jgi:hypothetical protein
MKKVTCINDKNQPAGACVVKGKEYAVETEYVNALDQRVYIIVGVPNEGTTKFGMRWVGYDALRFTENESVSASMSEYSFALN